MAYWDAARGIWVVDSLEVTVEAAGGVARAPTPEDEGGAGKREHMPP